MKKHVFPKKIIYSDGNIENIECLLKKKDLQIGLNESDTLKMSGKSSLLVDFGEEMCGGIRLLFANHDNTPTKLRIRFGESISEALSELGEKNSTNDHSIRDFTFDTTNLCDMQVGATGFRFVKIDKLTPDTILKLKSIVAVREERYKKPIGKFECDDDLLNQIYKTSSRTAKLCVQNGYVWDGIKRDRLVWVGDLHPEFLALSCMYSNLKEIKNSLNFAQKQAPLPKWMNDIPAYSMWWCILLYDYYFKTGDINFIKKNLSYLKKLTNQILAHINNDGTTVFPYNFIDWPTLNSKDLPAGITALTILTLKKIKLIYMMFDLSTKDIDSKLKILTNQKTSIKIQKQIMALNAIARNNFDAPTADFISQNGSVGFSTFMSYYILQALFLSGKKDESINLLKEYYGGMLDMGATTFWEDWDPRWAKNSFPIDQLPIKGKKDIHGDFGNYCYEGFRHSLCHGWAAGPTAFLTKYIAGIYPLSIGEDKILIKPYLGNLTQIHCVYPTIHGKIKITHKKDKNGKVSTKTSAPKNIKLIFEDCKCV